MRRLGGIVYSYLASSFAMAAIILFFGNIYILPYFGYDNMLVLTGLLSGCNFFILYMLNEKPQWAKVVISMQRDTGPSNKDRTGSPTSRSPMLKEAKELSLVVTGTSPLRMMSHC